MKLLLLFLINVLFCVKNTMAGKNITTDQCIRALKLKKQIVCFTCTVHAFRNIFFYVFLFYEETC